MDWSTHYPAFVQKDSTSEGRTSEEETQVAKKTMLKQVEVADIGCGFGGLLFALAPKMPETLILGTYIHHSRAGKV